jgi:hypothetical protein
MVDIDLSREDLDSPEGRRAVLSKIPPERAVVKPLHAQLREIFRREMEFREALGDDSVSDDADYFESLYHCGLLLYLIGDPADVPLMWEAKHIDMDTGCGFDAEFLVGAGVEKTIAYLRENGHGEIADYLVEQELVDRKEWEQFQIGYFYPD